MYDGVKIPRLPALPVDMLPALFTVADAVVVPDTGPFHIAAAARAYSADRGYGNCGQFASVMLVCGSSNPFALLYAGNDAVGPVRHSCPIAPCGAHGYPGQETFIRGSGHSVYPLEKGSACIFQDYLEPPHLAPCMKETPAEEIVAGLRRWILL
ncbi:MAG: hypothetical protein HYR90_02960 [Candidatus Andersenbacteria bacterium]|nr:hypothetical protein [Candidatus Andersenbacteria bacterium]MBI3251118.1 hypothetical protein [Candidatus Andersenbacteria bacterium]